MDVINFAHTALFPIRAEGRRIDRLTMSSQKCHFLHQTGAKKCFAALMWELNQVNGIERIHFTAPHPQYMDDATLDALCLPKQVNYLHLPVQSGSNAVLKRMNRPY